MSCEPLSLANVRGWPTVDDTPCTECAEADAAYLDLCEDCYWMEPLR